MDKTHLKQSVKKYKQGIVDVPYERPLVTVVDKLLELTKQSGYSRIVNSEKHWEIVNFLCKMWADLYPDQYEHFIKKQKEMRANQKNKFASSKEGSAEVRHFVEIPMKLYQLIMAIFPDQKFDKKFSIKLAQRVPMLRWSEKI